LSGPKSEILIEFVVQGNVVKVTAVDSATGIEAAIMGPANGARDALTHAAVKKLKYMMRKKKP
jgi:hypothetical protein